MTVAEALNPNKPNLNDPMDPSASFHWRSGFSLYVWPFYGKQVRGYRLVGI